MENILTALVNMEGLTVESCGSWLWVSGNTKAHKEELKALGLHWAARKKMWYWKPLGHFGHGSKPYSMDYIRSKYGSVEYEKREEKTA